MDRKLLLLACSGVLVFAMSVARADVNLVARGTASFGYNSGGTTLNCVNAPFAIEFVHRAPHFVLAETWGPASAGTGSSAVDCAGTATNVFFATTLFPNVRQCQNVQGATIGVISAPYTLTQVGNTYTLKSTITSCNGRIDSDTITFTLGGATIPYSHKLYEGATQVINVSATLTRVV